MEGRSRLSRIIGSKIPTGSNRIIFKRFSISRSWLWFTITSYHDQNGIRSQRRTVGVLVNTVEANTTPRKRIRANGSKAFSGVSPLIPGVLYSFTSLFRRTPYFPGVSLNLLVFLVFTRFSQSSSMFLGALYPIHQFPLQLHQLIPQPFSDITCSYSCSNYILLLSC